jgi:hypothetical protein
VILWKVKWNFGSGSVSEDQCQLKRELNPSHDIFGSMRLVSHLSNGLASAAFFLIAIAILAGGCNHPGSKNSGSNTTAPVAVSQLSAAHAGKRITVRGKLFMFKCGQGIQLDDGDVVCLVDMPPKSAFGDPYAGMTDKPPLEVTGILRFFHDSTPPDASRPLERQHDHYYFEYSTTQVRLFTGYVDNTTASSAGSQLSQALVGKRITLRGKLLGFKCGPSIELDDGEMVCLEDMHPKSTYEPYPGMFDKRVEATGTLRFFHDSTPMDENIPTQRMQDHYYFETESTQVRLIPN